MRSHWVRLVIDFVKDEDGPTTVEHAILLTLIAIVCITSLQQLGTNAKNTFNYVSGQIKGSGS